MMLPSSSVRSRRFASRRVEPTQQVLAFQLQRHWFALPVRIAYKVISIDTLYGAGSQSLAGLILYQNREIPVINIEQRIFGWSTPSLQERPPEQRQGLPYLLIVANLQGEPVGLPLESPPSLRRIRESAFSPLSATYLAEGNFRCVSALIIPSQTEPPLFLINLNQLMLSPASLPSGV